MLPGKRFPDVVNDDRARVGNSFLVPDEILDDVPAELRSAHMHPTAGSNVGVLNRYRVEIRFTFIQERLS